MANKIPDLVALERTGTGKGAARQTRREGHVPGVVYGDGKEPLAIKIPFNELQKRLNKGRFTSTLFNLKVEGHDDVRVICREIQRDVVKDLPTHFDLMRLRRTSRVSLFIPIEFINEDEAPGIKKGGVLTIVRPEVELSVIAGDIPEHIVCDLTGKEIGDVIHISEIELPKGARPTIDRDFVIANISAPSSLKAEEEEDEVLEEFEAAVEGEGEGEG